MSDPFDEYTPLERRGFARLLADAMRPHLTEAMQAAVQDYMGQNGEQHRADHAELAATRAARVKQETADGERKKNKEEDDRRFRSQVKGGIVLIILTVLANAASRLLGY